MTTQELTKEVLGMSAKVAGIESSLHEANTRLESVEKDVKEQGKLLQSIDRLAMGLTRLDEKMGDLSCKIDTFGSRINMIELKPAEKWERIIFEVLKYVVLAGVGFLAAKLIGGV